MLLKNRRSATPVSEEAIAKRAYEIWLKRGCPEGDGSHDWQTAESELLAEAQGQRGPLLRLFKRLCNRAAMA